MLDAGCLGKFLPVLRKEIGNAAMFKLWVMLLTKLGDLCDIIAALIAYYDYQRHPEAVRPWREVRAELVTEGLLDA